MIADSSSMASIAALKTWEGSVVDGKFPLRQCLGGSEHSAVFLTERSGKAPSKAAIKLIAAEGTDAEYHLARWRTAAQLAHPSLIRIFDTGRTRLNGISVLYLVTELADEDLSQILPERALTPSEVTDMLPPLLDALAYLHGRGFAHGRVKPSNILAVGDQLKLSSDQITSLTQPGSAGKRRDVYDAPESAAGIVSPESDLWSVGVTLVAALTQNVAFAEDGSQGRPALPESVPEPFRGIARECLQLDPKRRCSIAEIRERMRPPARVVPFTPQVVPTPRRGINRGLVSAVVLVIALVIGVLAFYPRRKNTAVQNSPASDQSAQQPVPQDSSQPSTQVSTPPASPPATQPAPPPAQIAAVPTSAASTSQGAVGRQVLPDISRSAMRTITGTIKVAVRVEVDPSGKVRSARLTTSGPSQYFARAALKAAQQWEFSAPVVNGQPAASAWVLRFRFRRTSTQVSPERVSR
jgi:TonB family protein